MNRTYTAPAKEPTLTEPLTAKEKEIVWMTSEGYTSREIGELMGLSFHTVRGYQKVISEKSGMRTTQFWKLREEESA